MVALEYSLAVPQSAKHRVTILHRNFISRCRPKRNENIYLYRNLYTIFMAALFVIAKIWKQPKHH